MASEATPAHGDEAAYAAAALAAIGGLAHADAAPLLFKTSWPLGAAAVLIAVAEFAWAIAMLRRGPTPMLLKLGAAGGVALALIWLAPFVFSAVWPGFPAPPIDPAGTIDAVAGLVLCALCITQLRGLTSRALSTATVAMATLLLATLVAGSHGSPPPASADALDRVSFVCHLG